MANRQKATEFNHLKTFQELVTEEVFKSIVTTAIESAKSGDSAAREWIGLYCMGKPSDIPCRLSGISMNECMQAESDELLSVLYPVKKTGRK